MEQYPIHLFGKILIIVGIFIVLVGIVLLYGNKIPLIGKLPGDILIKKDNFTFYFPLTTLIIVNVLIFIIIYLLKK